MVRDLHDCLAKAAVKVREPSKHSLSSQIAVRPESWRAQAGPQWCYGPEALYNSSNHHAPLNDAEVLQAWVYDATLANSDATRTLALAIPKLHRSRTRPRRPELDVMLNYTHWAERAGVHEYLYQTQPETS